MKVQSNFKHSVVSWKYLQRNSTSYMYTGTNTVIVSALVIYTWYYAYVLVTKVENQKHLLSKSKYTNLARNFHLKIDYNIAGMAMPNMILLEHVIVRDSMRDVTYYRRSIDGIRSWYR